MWEGKGMRLEIQGMLVIMGERGGLVKSAHPGPVLSYKV